MVMKNTILTITIATFGGLTLVQAEKPTVQQASPEIEFVMELDKQLDQQEQLFLLGQKMASNEELREFIGEAQDEHQTIREELGEFKQEYADAQAAANPNAADPQVKDSPETDSKETADKAAANAETQKAAKNPEAEQTDESKQAAENTKANQAESKEPPYTIEQLRGMKSGEFDQAFMEAVAQSTADIIVVTRHAQNTIGDDSEVGELAEETLDMADEQLEEVNDWIADYDGAS